MKEEFYLKISRLSWAILLVFVLILLIVAATASKEHIDGALKGGLLAIGVFMLICVLVIAGKTLMRDQESSLTQTESDVEVSSHGMPPVSPGAQ